MSPETNEIESKDKSFTKSILFRSAPGTILGLIILTLACSALYDLLFKPGINFISRFFLNLVTFGSITIKNVVYSSAAMDPRPLSVLLIGLFLICIPASYFIVELIPSWKPRFLKKIHADVDNIDKLDNNQKKLLKNKLYRMKLLLSLICLLIMTPLYVGFTIHNQSIYVWRIFHQNMSLISPYISDYDRKSIFSEFAAMEKEEDFLKIERKIQEVSAKNKIKFFKAYLL